MGAADAIPLSVHALLGHPPIHPATGGAAAGRTSTCGPAAATISGCIDRHDIQLVQK